MTMTCVHANDTKSTSTKTKTDQPRLGVSLQKPQPKTPRGCVEFRLTGLGMNLFNLSLISKSFDLN